MEVSYPSVTALRIKHVRELLRCQISFQMSADPWVHLVGQSTYCMLFFSFDRPTQNVAHPVFYSFKLKIANALILKLCIYLEN